MQDTTAVFKDAFIKASHTSLSTYSLSIRLSAALLICIATVLVVAHFTDSSHKESDAFLLKLTGFGVKVFIGFCLALLCLIY